MSGIEFFKTIEKRLNNSGIEAFKAEELIAYQEEIINWLENTGKYDDFFYKLAFEIVKADEKIASGENNEKDWFDELFTMSHEIFSGLIRLNSFNILEYVSENYALEIDEFISQLKEKGEESKNDIDIKKQMIKTLLLINNLVYIKFYEIEYGVNINDSQQVKSIDINSINNLELRVEFFDIFVDWVKNINITRENIIINKINNQDEDNYNSDNIWLLMKIGEFTDKKIEIQKPNGWSLGIRDSIGDFLQIIEENNENFEK